MPTRIFRFFLVSSIGIVLISALGWLVSALFYPSAPFNGQRAFQDVLKQVSFGPRTPGSLAHNQTVTYIQQELEKAGWLVEIQKTFWNGFEIKNIYALRSTDTPNIIVGAHYDSRLLADQDLGPERTAPVPGANDGASGVAVLLELARSLPEDSVPVGLVFFDAEDNGGLENREWIMGSRAFVTTLKEKPQSVVIVDMVGDADLNIFLERNSDPALSAEIWGQAASLGYEDLFISSQKFDMIDDHIPFLEKGINTVLIIDFDYPYWHRSTDTVDKVSSQSLQVVGEILWTWIVSH
jgi:glutaminyl-peptide cyclotransferase